VKTEGAKLSGANAGSSRIRTAKSSSFHMKKRLFAVAGPARARPPLLEIWKRPAGLGYGCT
jgi:hypothetical protein